ncbi:unnamed protein product [Boreogadus saida]
MDYKSVILLQGFIALMVFEKYIFIFTHVKTAAGLLSFSGSVCHCQQHSMQAANPPCLMTQTVEDSQTEGTNSARSKCDRIWQEA